jgi:hypothetical protein
MNQIPSDPLATPTYLIPSLGYCTCDNQPEVPSPYEEGRSTTRPDGDEMRAEKYAELMRERDEAREERTYWRRIAQTLAPPYLVVAIPAGSLTDITKWAERAEAGLSAALDALRDARAMIPDADSDRGSDSASART